MSYCVPVVLRHQGTMHLLRVFVRISEVSADVLGSRSGLVRVRSRDSKDDIQSATHRQIWLKRVCVARQQETLDAGHGERSILAHPVNSDASALRRGRASFGGLRLFVVGSNEAAEAERAQSVIVGLDRLSKPTEYVADLIAVCAHCCVNKYTSV